MTTTIERLRTTLAALSLTAIDARLETLLESASKKESSYGDFLFDVMSAEADARKQRYLKTRLQLAHLPYLKTFDQFDFAFQPSIDERQIRELRTLRFVHEASNVILLGPPGVGKTQYGHHRSGEPRAADSDGHDHHLYLHHTSFRSVRYRHVSLGHQCKGADCRVLRIPLFIDWFSVQWRNKRNVRQSFGFVYLVAINDSQMVGGDELDSGVPPRTISGWYWRLHWLDWPQQRRAAGRQLYRRKNTDP